MTVMLRGGAGTIAVDPDQLDALAGQLDRMAIAVEGQVLVLAADRTRPGPAALADPVGAGEVVAQLGLAAAQAGQLLTGCLALATSLRIAARGYRQVDATAARVLPLVRAAQHLPDALARIGDGPAAMLVADPQLADAGGEILTGLTLGASPAVVRPDAPAVASGRLATLYADGTPTVHFRPEAPTLDVDGPPRSLAGLLRGVAQREEDDLDGGAVGIRLLDGPAGRRVVLDIAGTTSWDLDPTHPSAQVSDFGTNLRALADQPSVLSRGIRQALREAGVGPDVPIMLVGHSQGGMVAAQLAGELSRDREFTVTHVVTAGSPIGLDRLPSSISVLSLENRGDVVPELDGADNPARPNWITATVDHGPRTVLGRHSIDSYVAGADDVDRDPDQAVTQWQSGAADYLTATSVRTLVVHIGRR